MRFNPEAVALVVYGPSQVGKSSTIRCVRRHRGVIDGPDPEVGRGFGQSVTQSAKNYSLGQNEWVVDAGGWNDTELRFTVEDMATLISAEVAAQGIQKVQFAIFDSLSGDTLQLRQSVDYLLQGFGDSVRDHILVIMTKKDRLEHDELEAKVEFVRQTMTDLGIGGRLVLWQNTETTDAILSSQIDDLTSARDRIPVIETELLEDLNRRILQQARLLHENQEPRVITQTVDENYVEPREELEEYEEQYTEWVKVTKNHLDNQAKHSPVYTTVRHFGTFGIGTIIAACRTDKEYVPVEKTRTKTRKVTHYDNMTRPVQREVEVFQEVMHFLLQARQEILEEVRRSVTRHPF